MKAGYVLVFTTRTPQQEREGSAVPHTHPDFGVVSIARFRRRASMCASGFECVADEGDW